MDRQRLVTCIFRLSEYAKKSGEDWRGYKATERFYKAADKIEQIIFKHI